MSSRKTLTGLILTLLFAGGVLPARSPGQVPTNKPPINRPPKNSENPQPGTPSVNQERPEFEPTPEQQQWAKTLEAPVEYVNSLGMTMRIIPPGEFVMGRETADETMQDVFSAKPEATADERPQHRVKVTKLYYMQATEETQGQWEALMGTRPWLNRTTKEQQGKDLPACHISWNEAVQFCQKLSEREENLHYRLPTEAEWEYACRAGSSSMFYSGNDPDQLTKYAWFAFNTSDAKEPFPHRGGTKLPNRFGLYDMHGNVSEWCLDWYHKDFYKQSPAEDPVGPDVSSERQPARVKRGGSWFYNEFALRSSDRKSGRPQSGSPLTGFRVVMGEPLASKQAPVPGNRPPVNRPPGKTPPPGNTPPANRRPGTKITE